MAKIEKHILLGQVAQLTLDIKGLERERDTTAQLAAAAGATASELATVLQTSRATAHRRYCQ